MIIAGRDIMTKDHFVDLADGNVTKHSSKNHDNNLLQFN